MAAKKKNKATDQTDNASDATRQQPEDKPDSKSGVPVGVMIEVRAYEIYQKRGDGEGDSLSDWLRAEQEIREELGLAGLSESGADVEPEPEIAELRQSSRAAS